MKVDIQKVNSYEEEQAMIRVVKVTENIQTAINALENSALLSMPVVMEKLFSARLIKSIISNPWINEPLSIQRIIVWKCNIDYMNWKLR